MQEAVKVAQNSPFLSWIDFTGGEPADRRDFPEIVCSFLDHCPTLVGVHFSTNGLKSARVVEVCKRILERRPLQFSVTVSIDGPPEVNDRLRGIRGDFKYALKTYLELSWLKGVRVLVGMTLHPENVLLVGETVREITRLAPNFSYRNLRLNLAYTSDHYFENAMHPAVIPKEAVAVIQEFNKKKKVPASIFDLAEKLYMRRIQRYVETRLCPERCAALLSSIYLSENGTVYPCSVWSEPLGNVRESEYSLLPLLESDRKKALRSQLVEKECANCWHGSEAYCTLGANLKQVLGRTSERPLR